MQARQTEAWLRHFHCRHTNVGIGAMLHVCCMYSKELWQLVSSGMSWLTLQAQYMGHLRIKTLWTVAHLCSLKDLISWRSNNYTSLFYIITIHQHAVNITSLPCQTFNSPRIVSQLNHSINNKWQKAAIVEYDITYTPGLYKHSCAAYDNTHRHCIP